MLNINVKTGYLTEYQWGKEEELDMVLSQEESWTQGVGFVLSSYSILLATWYVGLAQRDFIDLLN